MLAEDEETERAVILKCVLPYLRTAYGRLAKSEPRVAADARNRPHFPKVLMGLLHPCCAQRGLEAERFRWRNAAKQYVPFDLACVAKFQYSQLHLAEDSRCFKNWLDLKRKKRS